MGPNTLIHAKTTDHVLGGFFDVYRDKGYGFLERVYANSMAVELGLRGLSVAREVPIEVHYKGVSVGHFRFDMLVNGIVLVEVKSADAITKVDERQVQNYLKATNIEVGLILNFGPVATFKRLIHSNDRKPPHP